MAERKPHGVDFESWVERQIREAAERGEFDNLPSAGKPLPWLNKPQQEQSWISRKMRSENLAPALPPTLALRKEVHQTAATVARAGSEDEVRPTCPRAARTAPPLPLSRSATVAPDLPMLTDAERTLLSEWLDRAIDRLNRPRC